MCRLIRFFSLAKRRWGRNPQRDRKRSDGMLRQQVRSEHSDRESPHVRTVLSGEVKFCIGCVVVVSVTLLSQFRSSTDPLIWQELSPEERIQSYFGCDHSVGGEAVP